MPSGFPPPAIARRARTIVVALLASLVVVGGIAPAAAFADGTDPVVTDPVVTDPVVTDPVVTDPVVTASVPDQPSDLVAQPADAKATVQWVAPASDGGSPLTGYDVAVTPVDPAAATAVTTHVDGAASTSAVVAPLVDGVDYTVSVVAHNAVGAGPAATAAVTPRTVPGAAQLGAVSAGDATATVDWSAPIDDGGAPVTGYVVTAQPSGHTITVAPNATSATVEGLVDGAATTLSVVPVNAAGDGPAVTSAAVVPRKPARLGVVVPAAATVAYGSASTVTASLVGADGQPVAARRVVLLYRVGRTGSYHTAAIGTTGSTGRVALRATFPAYSQLALNHPIDAVAAVNVAAGSVHVARRVSVSAAAAVRVGQIITKTGGVSPGRSIGSAVVLQKLIGTKWTTVASGKMTTRTAYRVGWKTPAAGVMSLRILVPGDASYVASSAHAWRQTVAPETVASISADILRNTRITLAVAHASGISDRATAKADVVALAGGHYAPRSAYQNAPGGSTPVDIRVVRALRALGGKARITVSEIAGGSHAPSSSHYRGEAMDISVVNGVSIAAGGNYSLVASVCRSYGASAVYDPAYDPYGGHNNHVHCQWGARSSD